MDVVVSWDEITVTSRHIDGAVSVVAAKDIPYVPNAHRLQNLSIYLPKTPATRSLVGRPVMGLPSGSSSSDQARYLIHIHGGAWRDPVLTSRSVEAAVAHAFQDGNSAIEAIIGINYTISPFPTHPTLPYVPWQDNDPSQIKLPAEERDIAREARHPMHIRDVLRAFALLRSFGLRDGDFVLIQTVLQPPSYWGLSELPLPPRPAALIGLNGLYGLPGLVYGLGESHEHLREVYRDLQGIAFGGDESAWRKASPAHFKPQDLAHRLQSGEGSVPTLVLVDQSTDDQLVPLNQTIGMRENLERVEGLSVLTGNKCIGEHAAPWKEGYIIWDTVLVILEQLKRG